MQCKHDVNVRYEAFTTAKVDKIFPGYQLCQVVKITDVSRTVFVPIIRVW
jgi:hypothetical protein